MKETQRIGQLFQDLYNGSPWLEITIVDTLKNITAEHAAKKVLPIWNSIWEITNHVISWRKNVLQRVQGAVIITPENNYIEPIRDTSKQAWQNTLKELEVSQHEWLQLLQQFNEEDFEKLYPNNNLTHYQHIHGIIQHDAYHLGQIVIMAKALKSLPS